MLSRELITLAESNAAKQAEIDAGRYQPEEPVTHVRPNFIRCPHCNRGTFDLLEASVVGGITYRKIGCMGCTTQNSRIA